MNNKKCDCFLGFLSGEEIKKSNFKEQVHDLAVFQKELQGYGMLNGNPQTPKQLTDGRKGYLCRFNFCPYCGEKIKEKSKYIHFNMFRRGYAPELYTAGKGLTLEEAMESALLFCLKELIKLND